MLCAFYAKSTEALKTGTELAIQHVDKGTLRTCMKLDFFRYLSCYERITQRTFKIYEDILRHLIHVSHPCLQ